MSSDQFSVINSVIASNDECYIATIVHVEGSAYRKEGTMMFISKQGIEAGLLSGGCVEQDLLARIENQEEKKAFLMIYDLRSEDDLTWGQGIGCDGSIHILVEPINQETRHYYKTLKKLLMQGKTVKHLKRVNRFCTNVENCFLSENGEQFGRLVLDICYVDLESDLPSWVDGSDFALFKQTFFPVPRLIIYGAGPDVKPIVAYAAQAGFHVVLSDWRPSYCNEEHIPNAQRYIIASPIQAMEMIQPSVHDYCLIMTHSFSKDDELVNYLLSKKLKYLGILGSKKRTEKLLHSKKIPEWVYYPVGLPISSESPVEIAISIIAELIQVKNSKKKVAQ